MLRLNIRSEARVSTGVVNFQPHKKKKTKIKKSNPPLACFFHLVQRGDSVF